MKELCSSIRTQKLELFKELYIAKHKNDSKSTYALPEIREVGYLLQQAVETLKKGRLPGKKFTLELKSVPERTFGELEASVHALSEISKVSWTSIVV